MRISDFSVKKRVTVLMLTILILILGGISLTKLGLEMLPDMDYPVISIITSYEGAAPEDIEESVTEPIETAIATVKNIKALKSESMENVSLITVEFEWGTNLDFAAQDLRDAIDQIADYLPRDVSRPLVMKFNLSQMPVLMYGVVAEKEQFDTRKYLEEEVANKLKHLDGVASVMVYGGDEPEKQIIINKAKLEFYQIPISNVVNLIAAANLNQSAGHIQERQNEYLLRTIAEFESIEEIKNLPVKRFADGSVIYVKDIAKVENGYKERRYHLRTNRKSTTMLMVSKESGANTLKVADRIKNALSKMESENNNQVKYLEIFDMGKPIKTVTRGAMSNLIIGGILAVVVMFLFLRNWRPTLAISLAIPISVVATFVPIYLARFSLNIMTLGGLALGVGMLVDNSIVVIENIYRHLEMGKNKLAAAREGAGEVAMAITASTLTTIAVFFPMLFAEGMTGILVRGLALTVAFSLFASLFVSLTIVPAMASVIFRANNVKTKKRSVQMFEGVRTRYLKALDWVLSHRKTTVLLVVLLLVGSFAITPFIGTEFMPSQDMPFMVLNVKMPVNTPLNETTAVIKQIEDIFMDTKGVKNAMTLIGPMSDAQAQADPTNPQGVNEAQVYARLYDSTERTASFEDIQETIRSQLPKIHGGEFIFMSNQEMMGQGQSQPIEINIFGNDLVQLKKIAAEIESNVKEVEYVTDVTNSMKEGKPEAHLKIDKERAFQYGFTAAGVATTIKTASLGSLAGIFREGGDEIDILVRLEESTRNSFQDILHYSLVSPMGELIPLNQIAHIEYTEGPRKISHEKQSRKVMLTANVTGTSDIGGVVDAVKSSISNVEKNLPLGYYINFAGSYEDMQEAFVTLAGALLLAIILVYSVMASQFESLKQPFVVMFTMPLAVIGVLLILWLSGTTLSVASFVGGIILAGIVVNNGIVLIDHTNKLRQSGIEKYKAIKQAGSDRIRPVLITATTTMLGMLPMAISTGQGSELKAPMALTVIGGLISATFLTLVFIPVVYSIVAKD
jgi:HAE1 family hydrophobic/amphiphilic exporter-1